jgi:hypothetical protein
MNIREAHLRAAAGTVFGGASAQRHGAGDVVQLAFLEADDAERDRGLGSTPLFGILLGRDPRDARRWLVAPADAMPVAWADDVWMGAPADPERCGGLWVRLSSTFVVSDPLVQRLPRVGALGDEARDRLVARVMSRVHGEAPAQWANVVGEIEAGTSWPVTHEDIVGWIEAAIPEDAERGEDLWQVLADCVEARASAAPGMSVDGAEAPRSLRYAAAVDPAPRREWACSLPDGRRLVLRRIGATSRLVVLIDLADDVVEVRVNGRRAEPGSYGYSAEVDLVADEGMVSIAITTGIGVTLTACFDIGA